MHRSLIALEKLTTFALSLVAVWAIFRMIYGAYEWADRDYDWNNPRGSYRCTRAHYVFYGFSLVLCFLGLVVWIAMLLERVGHQ
jgi:uncharacterized membrane protein YjdF